MEAEPEPIDGSASLPVTMSAHLLHFLFDLSLSFLSIAHLPNEPTFSNRSTHCLHSSLLPVQTSVMADPFSITLGALQLTGVAVKVSLLLKKKIKVFRNYSRELSQVLKGVDRQQKNFSHEVHLILRQAKQDEDSIKEMLKDAECPRWNSHEVQLGLNDAFPTSLDTIQGIIEEIKSTLVSLQSELACFDQIVWMGAKVRGRRS